MRLSHVVTGSLLLAICLLGTRPGRAADESIYLTPPDSILAVTDLEDVYGELGPMRRWVASHPQRNAEEDGVILTDRPSFTTANTVVPAGWAQLESGYQYTSDTHDGVANGTHNTPQLNLRVGILERVEFRILWNGTSATDEPLDVPDPRKPHASNMQAGFKFLVSKEDGWIPLSALVTTVFLPTGEGSEERAHHHDANFAHNVAPFIDYIYGWTFAEGKWSFVGSTGGVFNGRDARLISEYFQSLVLQRDYSEKFSAYYETYMIFDAYQNREETSSYFDGGVLWRPWKNVQFDWRAGWGLNASADDFYTGIGASFRY